MTVHLKQNLPKSILPSDATDQDLLWKSSNPSVAVAANGIVIGVGEGRAVITVTTSNLLTATCTVTVEEEITESGLLFELTDDESFYIVMGYYGNAKEYVIPMLYDGIRIIGIAANAFENNTRLQKISIPIMRATFPMAVPPTKVIAFTIHITVLCPLCGFDFFENSRHFLLKILCAERRKSFFFPHR